MLKTESVTTDVLVIGSGIAGMMAALQARKAGAEVALVSKSALGKESSTSYARTFRHEREDPATIRDIPGYDGKPGKHLEDWPLVHAIYEETPRAIEEIVRLGVPMVLVPAHGAYDTVASYRPKGSEHTHGGAIALDLLATVAREMGIWTIEGCSVISLLTDEGHATGASGLLREPAGPTWLSIRARAIILATGGAAGINSITSSSKEITGNGYAMAMKAGLTLKSMEFSSFYPVGLPTPDGRYVHCAPVTLMMTNALLLNDRGEDIVKKHLHITLQEAVPPISPRFDWLPRVVAAEQETGKVWLDLTKVPASEWNDLPERNWRQIRQTHTDMKTTPLAIEPLSQSFRGGLIVDTDMKTSLPGLYAAGEAAASWLAEMGISALPSCLAMGSIAGRGAAAEMTGTRASARKIQDEGMDEAKRLLGKSGKTSAISICDEIRRIMNRHHSPIKSKTSLQEGLKEMDLQEERAAGMTCRTSAELRDALEARAMLLTGRAMLLSALLRTESRGGFYRKDFPKRDDANWLRPVLVHLDTKTRELHVEPGEKLPDAM